MNRTKHQTRKNLLTTSYKKASKIALLGFSLLAAVLATFLPAVVSFAQTCVQPPAGLVSWWPGDGNADDIKDTNPGMLQNGATFAAGMVGQAFSFDGVNDYVEIPNSTNLNPQYITIDAWVNPGPDPTVDNTPIVLKSYTSHSSPFYQYGLFWLNHPATNQPNSVNFRLSIGNTHRFIQKSNAFTPDGSWHHVAGTYDGSTMRLYIDGNEVTPTRSEGIPVSGPIDAFPTELHFGRFRNLDASFFFFRGLIDEVEIFNRALSATEVQAIYDAGSAGKCKVTTVAIDIKPGSFPNSINLGSAGVVPVAILSSPTFDATQVDPFSVTLAGGKVKLIGKGDKYSCNAEDVNEDGLLDLVCHVMTAQFFIEPGDSVAVLEAETFSGQAIRGEDSIQIVP